jgi:hypothetical protein
MPMSFHNWTYESVESKIITALKDCECEMCWPECQSHLPEGSKLACHCGWLHPVGTDHNPEWRLWMEQFTQFKPGEMVGWYDGFDKPHTGYFKAAHPGGRCSVTIPGQPGWTTMPQQRLYPVGG